MRFSPRVIRLLCSGASFGAVGCCVVGWIGSGKFVIPPRRALEPRHEAVMKQPAEFGFVIEPFDVVPTDTDGVLLKAALLSPTAHPGRAEKTRRMRERLGDGAPAWGTVRGTVLMLHGRGGIKEDAFPVAERLVAAGFQCLIFDARAHGRSEGDFCTYGARETRDVSTVIDAAEARFGRERLEPLVIFGISQGAAVTLQALPREPRLRAAVVVSPFAELSVVADQAVNIVIGSWVPDFLIGMVTGLGGWRAGFSPGSIRPVKDARDIAVPVMVVHGAKDAVIPMAEGRRVHDALSGEGKRFRLVSLRTLLLLRSNPLRSSRPGDDGDARGADVPEMHVPGAANLGPNRQ